MAKTSVNFRRLLRGAPSRPILQLVFPNRQLEPIGAPLDPSADRSWQLTADNLFRVRQGRAEAVVHVEMERDWHPETPRRLFEYASAAVEATQLPVWSVVMLLQRGGRPPRGTGVYRIPGIGGHAFLFHYHVVPLWQLDARRMRAQLGLGGAPFCAAMRGADEELVRSLVEEVCSEREVATRDRRMAMQLLYVVSAACFGSEMARRIFHVEPVFQEPCIQELIGEWEDKIRGEVGGDGRVENARLLLEAAMTAAAVDNVFWVS